jgi:ribosome biogenesis protein ENP2
MVRRAPGAGEVCAYDVSGRVSASLSSALTVGSRATAADKRTRRKAELAEPDADLLHDFSFPTVSNRVKFTPDQRFVFASGTYPPQIHVYDTDQLSLKFKRHVSSEIVDFQILEDDWRKFALLSVDRYIDLHSPYGSHFRTRIPRFGRGLLLHRGTAELYVCGAGADVWRLSLEQGRFLAPLQTRSGLSGGNNVCGINPVNSLLAFGGESGLVDIWDPRTSGGRVSSPAGTLDVRAALAARTPDGVLGDGFVGETAVTAIRFDDSDGVSMAVGTSTGHTLLFDLRSPHASVIRDQGYGLPIKSVKLHADAKHCISADAKCIKVWDRQSGHSIVAVEPDVDINHVCTVGQSGVLCVAVEDTRVRSYYIPALGPAPRWCSFLDSVTEELEDRAVGSTRETHDDVDADVYENFKFVSHDDVEGLGLGHLVGTEMLKPYMHGYFVHMKLYRRAVDAASPFAYEQYRKNRAKEKMEADRESRIGKNRKRSAVESATVNRQLAEALSTRKEVTHGKKGQSSAARAASILEDSRFADMFKNTDFAVLESAERFQQLNPSGVAASRSSRVARVGESSDSDAEYLDQFDVVNEEENASELKHEIGYSMDGKDSDSPASGDDSLDSSSDRDGDSVSKLSRQASRSRMYEMKEASEIIGDRGFTAGHKKTSKHIIRTVPLGKRVGQTPGEKYQNPARPIRSRTQGPPRRAVSNRKKPD